MELMAFHVEQICLSEYNVLKPGAQTVNRVISQRTGTIAVEPNKDLLVHSNVSITHIVHLEEPDVPFTNG